MQLRPFGTVRWTADGALDAVDPAARTLLGAMLDAPGAQSVLLAAAAAGLPIRTVSRDGHGAELGLALEGTAGDGGVGGETDSETDSKTDGAAVRIHSVRLDPVDTDAAVGLSRWLRRIAHDYNNVFGAILGEADLLGVSDPDEETKLALGAIEQGVQAGLRLRERLVVLGRLSADREGGVDPAKILARWEARGQAGPAGQEGNEQPDAILRPALISTLEPAALEGFDPGHLSLALEEVLDNATLAAGAGSDSSWMRVDGGVTRVTEAGLLGDAVVRPGNWRWLRIADSGRCAAGSSLARLRRPGVSLWPRAGRTGTGLTMASAALSLLDGVLALDLKQDEAKRDSAVWLLLPVDDQGLTRRTLPDSESVST